MRRTRHLALVEPGDGASPTVPVRSLLTNRVHNLTLAKLGELLAFSARDWTWQVDRSATSLAERGLLVSDEPGDPFEPLRRRDAELSELGWHPAAAAFHLATLWDRPKLRIARRNQPRSPVRQPPATAPPTPFYTRGGDRLELPAASREGELRRLLDARRTVRSFDTEQPVTASELATLLDAVWGAHARTPLAFGDTALRKTSPSGGGLHPVEVYPVVCRVGGVPPGVYHYLAGERTLERLSSRDEEACAGLLERSTAGQWYLADADVGFVMTARFARSFWKYRHHEKAFRTILLDAGHLSQTFYLACVELGLGAYVTAALDDGELSRALNLDPLFEAPVALCGCGRPAQRPGPLEPQFHRL